MCRGCVTGLAQGTCLLQARLATEFEVRHNYLTSHHSNPRSLADDQASAVPTRWEEDKNHLIWDFRYGPSSVPSPAPNERPIHRSDAPRAARGARESGKGGFVSSDPRQLEDELRHMLEEAPASLDGA